MFSKQQHRRRLAARLCRIEQLETRQLLTAAIWNNVLQPLDVVPNNFVTPLDALLIINEINNPVYSDKSTRRLPDEYNGTDTPPMIDVTCDQHVTPIDALSVINVLNSGVTPPGWQFSAQGGLSGASGHFEAAACSPRLVEGNSLVTQLQSQLKTPSANSAVKVTFETPRFDETSAGTMRDAFEILVVDSNNQAVALPYRYGRESSYNWSEQLAPLVAAGSQTATSSSSSIASATINLSGVAAGTPVKVIARLLNNDRDDTSSVVIRSVEFVTASGTVPAGLAAEVTPPRSASFFNMNALTDVTSTFSVHYGRTTLTSDPQVVSTDFQLSNAAALPVRGDLIAVFRSQADATAQLMNPDGYLADGAPYVNLSSLAPNGVAPGDTLASRPLMFRVSTEERFSYDIQLFSGFNQAPTLAPVSNAEILTGKLSSWQLQGADPDGDALSYEIVGGPTGMTIDAGTGQLRWTPAVSDVGRWAVVVAVSDRFEARAIAPFEINVRADIPNRPPVITSNPNTDAQITSPFDVLTYPLGAQPMAADLLPSASGLASVITANAGQQQLGLLGSQFDTLAPTKPMNLGEPAPTQYPTSFITGLNVPLDLAPQTNQNIERELQGVLAADVNRDGTPDIVVAASLNNTGSLANANELGYVIVRLGNADGTFREGWRNSIPVVTGKTGRVARMHWSDVTGDELPDLVVTTVASNQTLVFAGLTSGTLASTPIVSSNVSNVVVSTQLADINRDGRLDLVTIESQGNFSGRQGIGIQLGDGTGRFSGTVLVPAENDNGGLAYVADVDGVDGPDLVRLNYNNTRLETWLNDGAGQFATPIYSEVRSYFSATDSNGRLLNPTTAYIDDFNGDGQVDALVSSYQSIVLLVGQGDGKFGNRTLANSQVIVVDDGDSPQWSNVSQTDGKAIDFDGNGTLDFLFGDGASEGNLMIGLQQADGSFKIAQYSSFFPDDIGMGTNKSARANPLLAIADFNLDGVNDVVTGSLADPTQPASVGIFLGDGPGTLRAPRFINSYKANSNFAVERGRGGNAVAGDFNNDGFEDIVTGAGAGFGHALFFAAGHGDGSFEPDTLASGGITDSRSLTSLDIDRDGNLDLAWIDGSRSGTAFGLGNGAFQTLPGINLNGSAGGVSTQSLQVDDFNADGYPDLVMRLQTGNIDTNFTTRIVVLLFNPTARRYERLSDAQNILTDTPRRGGFYLDEAIGKGDLNNDGVDEFFTYSVSIGQTVPGRFTIWQRRNTLGTDASDFFTKTVIESPSFIAEGTAIHAYVVSDFDHDGKNDIAYSNHVTQLVVMFGNGDFTFHDPTVYPTNGQNIRGADVNGDGRLDIVSMWSPGFFSNSLRPYAGILLGREDGSFGAQQALTASADYTFSPVIGDFNGDGIDDLTGLGGLKHLEAYVSRPTGLNDMVTGDVNGDGLADVVALSQDFGRVKLLLGQAGGNYQRQADLFTDLLPVDLELLQADDDGLLDILTANRVGQSLSLFTHNTNGSFARHDIELPVRPSHMVVGDISGDGQADILVVSQESQSLVGLVRSGNSTTVSFVRPLGFAPSGVALGDVNGDGRVDVVLSDEAADRIVFMAGQANGTFGTPTFVPGIAVPTHLALADMNSDGRLDIVVTQTQRDQLGMLFNRGQGRFTNPQTITLGDAPSSIRTRDANNDGRPDLLVTNAGDNTLSLILNRFDPDQVWSYQPTATDPDGDAVQFDLTTAPGGMLFDDATGRIYWAPMPEQLGRSAVAITASDGRGGVSEQGFVVNVTAPAAVASPVFTSLPVSTFAADEVYHYQPNVQSEIAGSLRYSLVEAPEGMTIDPGTGAIEWDARLNGLKLYANSRGFSPTVNNINFGQLEIPDSPTLRSSSVTAEGWFNFVDPRGALYEQLLSKGSTANRNDVSWGLEYFFGTIRARVGRADGTVLATVSSPVPVTFNKWTHLAMTFDDATKVLLLMVDGQVVGTAVSPESITYSNRPFYSGSNQMVATRMRVWNSALNAAEIAQNQLADVPNNAPGLILKLAFNETADATTIIDASPAGNNGSIINGPDFYRFPERIPTLASRGTHNVRMRVEDGRGGVAEQSFTVTSQLPYTSPVNGVVFDDLDGDGVWDKRAGENLVLNGDFSAGNKAFETDFYFREQTAAFSMGERQATVANAASVVPQTSAAQGHTYGGAQDLMLVVNGDAAAAVAWRQTVSTQSGMTYAFSFWAMRPNSFDPPRLLVRLNGQQLGAVFSLSDTASGIYKQFTASFTATGDQTMIEIVSLGTLNPPQASNSTAENVVTIDDVLLLASDARRVMVSGKANPYLAGMPDGSTALGSSAPASSPTAMSVTPGEVLRFAATGQTTSQGFIVVPSADGYPSDLTTAALNGLSGYKLPVTGALVGVFLDSSAPGNQTAPALLDYNNNGNVPGGLDFTSLAPALRQMFFIGDGKNAQGFEQTVTVPSGATRLMLATAGTNSWQNNRGEFEVQVFNATSEPTQAGRTVFIDRNFNNRFDDGEQTVVTDQRGLFRLETPGNRAQLGLLPQAGSLQTGPVQPYIVVPDKETSALTWSSRTISSDAAPQFISVPAASPTIELSAPTTYTYQAFAQAANGLSINYSVVAGPIGFSVDRVSGLARWNPRASDAGEHDVILKAIDSVGRFTLQRYSLRVTANTSPIIVSLPPLQATQQVPFQYQVLAQDAEQSSLRYALVNPPAGMSIETHTGLVNWTPTSTGSVATILRVTDERGGMAEQNFNIEVVPSSANHAPVIDEPASLVAVVNRPYGIKVAASDVDHDRLTYELVSGPAGLTINSAGQVSWNPNELGSFDAQVRVSDGRGASDVKSMHLEVVSRPLAGSGLTITSNPTTAALIDDVYVYDVLAPGAVLFELITSPDGMSIDAARGTVRWLPTKDHLGVHNIKLRASDVLGNVTEQAFNIAVRSSAIVPTISSAPPTEASVGRTFVYAIQMSNASRSPLQFELTLSPQGMQIDATSGVISWTPVANQTDSAAVVVRAKDAVGNFSSQAFTIVVSAGVTNRPPAIISTASLDAIVGQPYSYALQADDADGGPLTYAVRSAPAGFTIQATSGVVSWTPAAGQVGTVIVILTATDPQGGVAVQSLAIDVRPANRTPTIRSNPTLKVAQGGLYQYDTIATDPDREPLFYELTTAPAGMTIDSLGRIRWQTQLDTPLGANQVSVRVRDGFGAETTQSFTFAVVADTQAPRIALIVGGEPVLYPWTSAPAIVRVIASDDVGLNSVQLKVDGQPVELAADGTARVYFTAPGNGRLEVLATDATGNVGRAVGRVNMRSGEEDGGGNPAPDVQITSVGSGAIVSGLVDVIGTAAAPDFESYTLSYRRADEASYKTIVQATSQVSAGSLGKWDTTLLENDNYVLKLEVIDTFGSFAATEVEVSVTGQLKLGNFRLSFQDMTIPVAGISLNVMRTYDSLRADRSNDFGYGWRLDYRNADLRTNLPKSGLEDLGIYTPFKSGTRVFITLPGGEREAFTFTPEIKVLPGFGQNSFLVMASPRFTPDRGVRSSLSAGGGSLIVNEFGELFAAGGIPWNPASADFGGYRLTTNDGTQYSIDGATGQMVSATDRNGNSISFSDTSIVASSGESISILRDTQGRIVELTDTAGKSIRYAYSSTGNLQSVTDRTGQVTELRYRPASHYLDQVIDPLGRTGARVEYDADGRLTKAINGSGGQSLIAFDIDNELVTVKDPLGRVTTTEYDSMGNAVKRVDANGGVTRFTYDENDQAITQTDALGNTTRNAYDVRGNIVESIDALGNRTLATYDRFGNSTSNVDALGHATIAEYDARGNLRSATDAAGNLTTVTLAAAGQIAQVTSTLGRQLDMQYGGGGNVSKSTDARGLAVDMTYTAGGQLKDSRYTTTLGSQTVVVTESRTYDAEGRMLSWTNAAGETIRNEYDAAGQLTATIDALGRRTTNQYDGAGRKLSEINPDGTQQKYVYDLAGQLITVIDVMNRSTYYEYDAAGRKITTIYPDDTPATLSDNPRTRTEYDAVGNAIVAVDETGLRTVTTYDAVGRPVRIEYPGGSVRSTEYDAAGKLIADTDPLGRTTRYRYDALGNVIASISADGRESTMAYDARGQRIQMVDSSGAVTRSEYGADGQLMAVVDPLGNRTVYTRDNRGQIIATTNPNGQLTTVIRDALGREVGRQLPGGQLFTTQYDAVGNVLKTINPDGQEIRYEYDVRNRISKKTIGSSVTLYTYSASGMMLTTVDQRGTTTYQYDARDRLIGQVEPDGQVLRYSYDAAGRRLTREAVGKTESYTYDSAGRLASVKDGSGQLTRYTYDLSGQLVKTEYPNGVVENRTYSDAGELLRIAASHGSTVMTDFRYTFDVNGRVVNVTDADARQTEYRYDRAGRLMAELITSGGAVHSIEYEFDAAGNRLRKIDSQVGITTYHYDVNDRLTSSELDGVTTGYTYNASGDLLTATSATEQLTNVWDAQHRLIKTTRVKGGTTKTEQYEYDDAGNRVRVTDAEGQSHRWLLDTTGVLAQIIAELAANGVVLGSYTRGLDLISTEANGTAEYYLADRLGNIRATADAAGNRVESFVYDAYGVLMAGAAGNARFTGEPLSVVSNYTYLRARYYDAQLGQFVSADPYAGDQTNPISLHKYVYAHLDPTNLTDPSGLTTDVNYASLSVAMSLISTLSSVASIAASFAGLNELSHWLDIISYVSLFGGLTYKLAYSGTLALLKAGPAVFKAGFIGIQEAGANFTFKALSEAAKVASKSVYVALRESAISATQYNVRQDLVKQTGRELARRFVSIIDQHIAESGFKYLGKPGKDIFVAYARRELQLINNWLHVTSTVNKVHASLLMQAIEEELAVLLV